MIRRPDIPRSSLIAGLEWLGPRVGYPDLEIKGDTFPMTWADDDEIYASAGDPLWGETRDGLDVEKFSGGPAFVNFGKNNANARDEFVYAVSSDQWDNGSNLRLGRVPADKIVNPHAWEWVCAFGPSGEPAWNWALSESIPVLSLHRMIGAPEMVYLASIKRYLLLTWRLHADFSPNDGTDFLVFESPEPWGPFALVHYEEYWEGKALNPYCPRVPLKWMESDGVTGWLQFSGGWGHNQQIANLYRSHVRPFRLRMK